MKVLITGGSGFIGTNLMDYLLERGVAVRNLDRAEPKKDSHRPYWAECDILEEKHIEEQFARLEPARVIHLAARTDVEGRTLADYQANTVGTAHVLRAIQRTASVQRVIITSSQQVNEYNGQPKHDEDYAPHTVYGESKVITERFARRANLSCVWTIVRPTNIWGPWHPRYPFEFWRILAEGLYLHPGREPVIRSYGYVGNVVYQAMRILESPPEAVHGRVYYLGDMPINLYDWVNGFSLRQTGRSIRVAPRGLVRGLAILGDVLKAVGIRFPITSSRFKSMTTGNGAPMEPIFKLCGAPPYTLEQGIEATTEWMRRTHPRLIRVKKETRSEAGSRGVVGSEPGRIVP